ncbi:hypothetical protein [Mesorhizobium argentiipisi]|uniref:DUF4238 domain-containing protein n=1 Tax=Mesorhizobium argentiipisi TaxID=3015175 RepID=A0ABU8KDB8_9HYPH
MSGTQKSKNHHWWPVGLQSHWANYAGDVSWIEPSGNIISKRTANRKIGFKIHGHTILRGSAWESSFEAEFDIDNEVHKIIAALKALRPFGWTPREFFSLIKLRFKKNTTLRDRCKYYHLDETLHRNLLLLMHSLLIRSPANRSRYESYSRFVGRPPDEEVGKLNMMQRYALAKKLCQTGLISNQYFVLLHSPWDRFIFGDGSLDWMTNGLAGNRISGRTLIPLTPHLCVYFCTPMSMRPTPNCASLLAAPWMVDWINDITQVYSKDKLFFLGKAPKLTEAFRQAQFLEHKKKSDDLIEMLDEIAGFGRETRFFAPGSIVRRRQ